MSTGLELGRKGEDAALEYLLQKGLRLRDRNWRTGHLEIDLVMESENYVHVIEVKTLTTPMFVSVSDNVDKRKRINLINAAKGYMARYKVVKEVKFDVVSVVFVNNEPEVEYIPDAFLPIYGA